MATQTRVRASTAPRGERRSLKPAQSATDTGFARFLSLARGLWRWLAECFASPTRLRREMIGVGLVLAALLSSWSLGRGERDGRVIAWWGDALAAAFGRAAPLVPVFIALIAIRAFSTQREPVLFLRHYAGGFGFAFAVLGLIGLGSDYDGSLHSGHLGDWIASLFRLVLGQLGSGLFLLATGFVSVFLLAGTDLQTFENDIRALLPRPKKSRLDDLGQVPVVQAKHPQLQQTEAVAPFAPSEPATRVINIPNRPSKIEAPPEAPALLP
nr:DNA translocase FtsK 4TM domain-containing protein [Chloroflexota bacterium]